MNTKEQTNLFKGRDKRKKGWFWMDNDYLNGYAKYFGAVGTAVYVSLCRHANNDSQECFPAQSLIADELNIARRTVSKYLKLFEKHRLIKITQEQGVDGKFKNNIYKLLDKTEWKTTVGTKKHTVTTGTKRYTEQHKPCELNDTNHGNLVHNKETKINKTNINKTNKALSLSLIDYFFELKGWANKSKDFYKHKKIVYSRFTRPAKSLAKLCDQDGAKAKYYLRKVANWANSRDLDWSIGTVIKRWGDIDKLEPKTIIKKPYFRGMKVIDKGNKLFCVPQDGGEWLEFAGKKSELVWK